jgi:hypothetical protein
MKKKIRRRHATLMELLISLGLTATLITILLGSYWQAQRLDLKTRSARSWLDARQLVQIQLQRWVSNATMGPKQEAGEEKKVPPYFFYSDGSSLTWTAHSLPTRDPRFSGDLLLRLYVNPEQQLCLRIWPLPTEKNLKEPVSQQIVLAKNVASIALRFYLPPPQAHQPPADTTQSVQSGWSSQWPIDLKKLPAMVQLQINQTDGSTLPLAFQLPEGSPLIVFPKNRRLLG